MVMFIYPSIVQKNKRRSIVTKYKILFFLKNNVAKYKKVACLKNSYNKTTFFLQRNEI